LQEFPLTAMAIITADPIVVKAMTDRVKALLPRAAQLQRDLAAVVLAETATVQQRLGSYSQLPPATTSLNAGHTALLRADQLRAAGDLSGAYYAARNSMIPAARWRREVWLRSLGMLGSPVASPLATSFSTAPEHLGFMASLAGAPTGDNLLA